MFLITNDILHRPLHTVFERMLPHIAIRFVADVTREIKASIRMDEHFKAFPKFVFDQLGEFLHFSMCFMYIKVPWYSQMSVEM
jgi:2-hydroxy-3-keto-5-methylthiopentenyl-1-phosphate phosphatase